MRELLDDFEEDAELDAKFAIEEGSSENVAALLQYQIRLEDHIEKLEAKVSQRKQELRALTETTIPEAFVAAGMSGFTVSQGWEVVVEPFVYTSFTQKMDPAVRAQAFKWLRDTKNDAIISNVVSASFGKGEDQKAQIAVQLLAEKGISATATESIHASRLQSFIRKELEANRNVPLELFNAHTGTRSKIKRPGKSKGES